MPQAVPGPSSYDPIDNFNNQGKYCLSQRRGKGTRPFDRQQKFTIGYWRTKDTPGPGTYEKPSDFGCYGDYLYYKTMSLTSN